MNEIAKFSATKEDRVSLKVCVALIALAWAFGVVCRLYWLWFFSGTNEFYWLGQFMINTNDGYFWAEGARDLLEKPANIDELSPVTRGLPIITAALAKCLPFVSFETLILYMPAFIGSLLAIPVVLIGRALNQTKLGFVAALISVIAWSYYNRTMIGYYDDDMLVLVLPMFVLYALVAGISSRKPIYWLLSALFTIASIWYYPNSQLIIFGMGFILLIYAAILHIGVALELHGSENEKAAAYCYKLLLFLLLGAIALRFGLIGLAALIAAFALAAKYDGRFEHPAIIFPVLAVAVIASIYISGVAAHFWAQFSGYITRDATSVASDPNATAALHFFNVAQTVREAGSIPFSEFASRISGNTIAFFIAAIATAAMLFRYRVLLLSLPFIGLGFMAYGIPGLINGGGLRFTIYAVPALALGLSYLIFWIADRVHDNLLRFGIAFVLSAIALAPHIMHIRQYLMPTVFYSYEVAALDRFKQEITPRKDYAISWWDYGYPFRYYSYAKTLADGGKHSGADNFAPSFILTTESQEAAAKMSRLTVEYTEKQFADRNFSTPILSQILVDYNATSPDLFMLELADRNITLPEHTREIYLALPHRMGEVFPAVMLFSSLDLATGRQYEPPFFLADHIASQQNDIFRLARGIIVDTKSGVVRLGGRQEPKIKRLYTVGYDQEGKFIKRRPIMNQSGDISVIINAATGSAWLMDEAAFNSVFVQLFALENYDPALFQPFIMSPLIKIYKVML